MDGATTSSHSEPPSRPDAANNADRESGRSAATGRHDVRAIAETLGIGEATARRAVLHRAGRALDSTARHGQGVPARARRRPDGKCVGRRPGRATESGRWASRKAECDYRPTTTNSGQPRAFHSRAGFVRLCPSRWASWPCSWRLRRRSSPIEAGRRTRVERLRAAEAAVHRGPAHPASRHRPRRPWPGRTVLGSLLPCAR